MTIEKLERVMWRLRKNNPNNLTPYNGELKKAIMLEIGIDPRTYKKNRAALVKLGWLHWYTKNRTRITNKDLTDA